MVYLGLEITLIREHDRFFCGGHRVCNVRVSPIHFVAKAPQSALIVMDSVFCFVAGDAPDTAVNEKYTVR